MSTDRKPTPARDLIQRAFKQVFRDEPAVPVAAAPSTELRTALATIEDLRREVATLRTVREEEFKATRDGARTFAQHVRVRDARIAALRQALMDIMTGNAVAPAPVPEPLLKLAHEAIRADDAAAKPPAPPKEEP